MNDVAMNELMIKEALLNTFIRLYSDTQLMKVKTQPSYHEILQLRWSTWLTSEEGITRIAMQLSNVIQVPFDIAEVSNLSIADTVDHLMGVRKVELSRRKQHPANVSTRAEKYEAFKRVAVKFVYDCNNRENDDSTIEYDGLSEDSWDEFSLREDDSIPIQYLEESLTKIFGRPVRYDDFSNMFIDDTFMFLLVGRDEPIGSAVLSKKPISNADTQPLHEEVTEVKVLRLRNGRWSEVFGYVLLASAGVAPSSLPVIKMLDNIGITGLAANIFGIIFIGICFCVMYNAVGIIRAASAREWFLQNVARDKLSLVILENNKGETISLGVTKQSENKL